MSGQVPIGFERGGSGAVHAEPVGRVRHRYNGRHGGEFQTMETPAVRRTQPIGQNVFQQPMSNTTVTWQTTTMILHFSY